MSLSGYHDWEADKWEFVYDLPTNPSESTGEISPVGPERQSPLAGLADFGVSLVRGIFEFIRDALSGVVQAGAAIIGPLVDGAISLLGGAFDFIGNLFFGWNGREKKPLPPIYSDVFTDIEAATQPFFDVVDKNLEDIELLSGELDNARAELDSKLDVVTEDIRAAELALEAVGDVDKKIADQALIHTQEAATALQEARDAMDALTSYQESNDAEVQALKQQAEEALRQAGDALTDYDNLWGDHEALKSEATSSIDALKQLTQKHNYSLETIESDLPGMKDSITTAQAKANAAVVETKVEYAVSSSETTAPTTGWSTSTPTRTPGRFVWMRSIVTYGSGSTTTTSPVLVTGNTGAKGIDGVAGKDGVGLESTVVMYAVSSSGTTPPTSGWEVAVPTLTQGNYLWTRTVWAYSDGSTEAGHSVSYLAKDGSDGDDGLPGKDGVGIVDTVITYAASSSGTTPPSTGWVPSPPAGSPGQFIWTRTVWHYSDKTSETGYSVGKIGNTGAKGDRGSDGVPGKDGVGLRSTTVTYALSTSGTTAPSTGWSSAVPTLVKGRYLWTRTVWEYSDSTSETGYSVSYVPTDGTNGNDGLPGKDGVSITSTTITYAKSTSGTTPPSSGWSSQPPATAPGDFVWTRTVWEYSDNTSETGYSIGKIGNTGAKGDQGIQGVPGPKGVDGKTTYTWIKYADSASGAGLSDSPVGKTYIGFAYNQTTATESTNPADYTWSLIKGEKGDQGNQGVPGPKGADGQPTYTWVKYSDASSGANPYDVPKASTKYIGIAVNKTTQTESTNPSDYTWSQFKGEDGSDGISVTAVVPYYQLVNKGASAPAKPTTASPSGWTTTEPDFQTGRELYRSDRVTFSSGTTSWTDVSKVSAYTASTEAMNTAVDALAGVFNSTDIGSSLVAYIPGTSTPIWADTMTPATPEENPQGLPEAYVFTSMSNTLPMPNSVSVNPGIDYKVSVWIKADKPDSKMYYELRDQDGTHAVQSGSIGGGGTYLINNLTLPTEWTLYETVLTFHPSVKRIYLARRYANHSNGTERNAVQYMADLRINPVTVTPADVTNTVKVVADSLNSYRTTNDKAVSDANKAAQVASGLAESKGEVIYQATAPTGTRASKANLWIRTSDNAPHTYDGSKWVVVTDQVAKDAAKAAADANALAKTKTTTYYQTTAPSSSVSVVGDLWIDQSTAGKNTLKRWSGSAWVTVQDKAIADALAAAGTAQSTADGKVRTFAQTSAPTGVTSKDVGDLWIDTDDGNKLYRWSGSAWVSLQDKGIVTALDLAQKGVDDAKAVADKISALDNRLETLSGDQEALGEKAQQGIEDAKYAADLVRNSVDIGTSLVALIPGTNRPRWSEGIEEVAVTDLPGVTVAYKASSTQRAVSPSAQWVKADPKVKYHVSFWAKASAPGSRFYIYFDNQDEVRALISNTLPGGGSTSLLANFLFPTEWTKYEGVIQLRDTTERVRFRTMYWNHPNGTPADQYLADFRIEPVIPSQDDVNQLLIDTAQNHGDILKAQGEINDIHAGKWKDQSALNAMQLEIDENQNTAIQGLTASTMLAFPHLNIAPNDSSGRPWWSVGMSTNSGFTPPGFPSGESYWTSSSSISNVNPEAMITVVPGIDYKLEFWTARVDAGTAGAYTDVRDESGKTVLTHWADVTDGVPTEVTWSPRNYAGSTLPTSTDWIRKVYLLRVRPGTNKMALHFRPGNSATTNGIRVRFWGAHLSAFMPIQEQLDSAQTQAILANAKINDSQDGLIAANNKAIKATTEAVSAHQRILQVAYPDSGSAIPMVPGGVNVGTADDPVYEAMPEWLRAFGVTEVNGTSGMEDRRAAHSTTPKRVPVTNPAMVRVNPTALYRYSFWIQASASGSEAYIRLTDQNGNGAVLENIPDAGMPTPRESTRHLFWFNGNVPFTNGWNKISGTIRLKQDVTHVYIGEVGLNHQGTITSQCLADIQLEPIIPSQLEVNEGFATAIEANTKAIRLAFPDMNLDPKGSDGHPMWTSRSTVTIINSGNPGGRNPAYRVFGGTGNAGGLMDLQSDLREYRIRGWVTPGSGTSPRLTIMVVNQSGTSVIEAWRPTFPADKDSASKEDSLKDYDEVQWTSGSSVPLTPGNGMLGSPGEWSELDIVVRLKAGETSVRLALVTPTTTNNWVLVNDIRFTTLNPSQWQVDYAQNRALTGLNEAFKAQQAINTTQDELNGKLQDSQQSLLASLRELQGAVWRVFSVQDVTYNSATELSTHIQVRKGSSSWVYVDARGSTWSGDMILTGYYDAGPPFVRVVKVTPGVTGRTNGVPRTQSYNGIQQLREVRIDFRVDPERIVATKVLENFDPGKSSVLRSDLEFDPNKTAAAAPNNGADGVFTDEEAKSPVLHYIDWEVVWDSTTASDSYLMEVGVVPSGGTMMNSLKFLRVDGPGPTFPWQNGRRTTTINVSANLNRGDKLVFSIWSGAGQSSQRKVAKTTRTVSWMKP